LCKKRKVELVIYDDAQDAVAAEYVLGTLSADEREHADALLSIDPGFSEAVRTWERRLGELNVMVEAVEPPTRLWDNIKSHIGAAALSSEAPPGVPAASPAPQPQVASGSAEALSQVAALAASLSSAAAEQASTKAAEPAVMPAAVVEPPTAQPAEAKSPVETRAGLARPVPTRPVPEAKIESSAEVVYLSRRVGHWRRLTVAFGAIAALLAVFIAVTMFEPGLNPLTWLSSGAYTAAAPATPGSRLVAVLQQEPTAPAFLLTVDPQKGTLIVRRVSAAPEPGRSYELWLISNRYPQPRSLGLVGADEFTQRAIPAGFDVDTMRNARYAVSLEPANGSPRGVPTGPVLFTGKMVEALPALSSQPLPPPQLN
jgi:anti-sigma-K factor RskA